jgi:hypothetical protein
MQPSPEMTNAWNSSPFLVILGTVICIAFLIGVALRKHSKVIMSQVTAPVELDRSVLRCPCGEEATHPSPTMARSRGDILRSLFGAGPRYRRTVEALGIPVYCRSHAHLADVFMDKFIYGVRTEQAETHANIAVRAANFEQEGLQKMILESLTDDQKRASRRPLSNVTRIGANGSNGGTAQ